MPMSTFIINNIFFSSCSHTPSSDYGVADIIGNIGQYILIYSLGTFADVEHGDYMVITWPNFLFWVGWPCNHPLSVDSMLNTSNFARSVIQLARRLLPR